MDVNPLWTVDVFVLATRGRDLAQQRLFESVRASDLIHTPESSRIFAPKFCEPGTDPREHWREAHLAASRDAAEELVLMLEDDALVNKYTNWNIRTWYWPHNKDFGAGWLYNPGGYAKKDTWYEGPPAWHGTVGVLYRTEDLPKLVERAWPRIRNGEAWDLAMSRAVAENGRRIRVHFPALIEHQNDVPSAIQHGNGSGNPASPMRTTRGTFRVDWRRPERHEHGIVDERGRSRL
jgi:hypothetical protein